MLKVKAYRRMLYIHTTKYSAGSHDHSSLVLMIAYHLFLLTNFNLVVDPV